MGTILGDLFKKVGGGLGKVFDGDILDGLGDMLGGVGGAVGRTVNGALNLVGLGEEEDPATAFCICTVGCLAKMAKADGRISQSEAAFLNERLDAFELDGDVKSALQKMANEQAQQVDDIYDWARGCMENAVKFASEDEAAQLLFRVYCDLFNMALADGDLDDNEIEILRTIPPCLGLREEAFDMVVQELAGGADDTSSDAVLADAYATLGVSPDASDAEVRNAWKRKMATFHPDKIQGKDLDPEWLELANEKSAKINAAYETIKAARKG